MARQAPGSSPGLCLPPAGASPCLDRLRVCPGLPGLPRPPAVVQLASAWGSPQPVARTVSGSEEPQSCMPALAITACSVQTFRGRHSIRSCLLCRIPATLGRLWMSSTPLAVSGKPEPQGAMSHIRPPCSSRPLISRRCRLTHDAVLHAGPRQSESIKSTTNRTVNRPADLQIFSPVPCHAMPLTALLT